jgi:hypothetical protein
VTGSLDNERAHSCSESLLWMIAVRMTRFVAQEAHGGAVCWCVVSALSGGDLWWMVRNVWHEGGDAVSLMNEVCKLTIGPEQDPVRRGGGDGEDYDDMRRRRRMVMMTMMREEEGDVNDANDDEGDRWYELFDASSLIF